jgi:hypothetical protein
MRNKLLVISLLAFSTLIYADEKLDQLLVYGEGFVFGVKEPVGWKADINNAAKMNANILFYHSNESFSNHRSLIYIRINKKVDENVQEDLKYDMKQYRDRYPKIQFSDISVSHASFALYAKLFYETNLFYEYVTYINPGKGKPFTLSAAMNVQKREANAEELAAYKEIISSLILIKP